MSDWAKRPIYVGGNSKSGKTLFASLLDSHPRILCLPKEIPFGPPGVTIKARTVKNEEELLDRLVDCVRRDYRELDILDEKMRAEAIARFDGQIEHAIVDDWRSVYSTLVTCISQAYHLQNSEFARWSFENCAKRTYHIFLESYPLGKVLHVRRDPRSWILSRIDTLLRKRVPRVKASQKSPLYVYRAIRDWLKFEHYADSIGSRFGAARFRVVSYEDLVFDPAKTMNAVWDFLALPPPPRLGPSIFKHSVKADGGPIAEVYRRLAVDWSERLHLPARLLIEVMARDYLTDSARGPRGS
jgi:hypothetical protein